MIEKSIRSLKLEIERLKQELATYMLEPDESLKPEFDARCRCPYCNQPIHIMVGREIER